MRFATAFAILIGMMPATVFASEGFDLVIPGRPGVPIIINGVDASYAVVEGDFGLGKGVNNQPTIIYGGRLIDPEPNVGHYYPTLGHRPGYGRLEIEPPTNRKLPRPAPSFHQSWSTPQPAQSDVPLNPPPVILAPEDGARHMPHNSSAPPAEMQNQAPRNFNNR